jgi:hypothetical protein
MDIHFHKRDRREVLQVPGVYEPAGGHRHPVTLSHQFFAYRGTNVARTT